jgi:hypothetical protein
MAEEVVYAPPHEETYDEEMQNVQEWIEQAPVVNAESKSSHDEDDILVLGENSFGGDVMITQAEPTLEIAPVIKVETQKEITINGLGPRRHTDSNRLKVIHQSARQNAFNANRTQVPEREKVAQWKTREERLGRQLKLAEKRSSQARQEQMMRNRDYGKIKGADVQDEFKESFKALPAPVETTGAPQPKKITPPSKTPLHKSARKSGGTAQRIVEINNLKRTILTFTQKEADLKKKGRKLNNRQFLALHNAEKALADLLK